MNKNIILFDMDGTLTEPRKKFESSLLSSSFYKLSNFADIGIVTGSDIDYLKEQMSDILTKSSVRYCLHLLPCNGTKWYRPPHLACDDFKLVEENNMESKIGVKNYRKIIEVLIEKQHFATDLDIPLTGHFISTRGSLINWSPAGRNANDEQRGKFIKFDKKYNYRKSLLTQLRTSFEGLDVTVKLGGDTSFDIYPTGWDKTFCLRYFSDKVVWFVGDRVTATGNDFEIFNACSPRSFQTTGPSQTVEIIEQIIKHIGG